MATLIVPAGASRNRLESVVEEPQALAALVASVSAATATATVTATATDPQTQTPTPTPTPTPSPTTPTPTTLTAPRPRVPSRRGSALSATHAPPSARLSVWSQNSATTRGASRHRRSTSMSSVGPMRRFSAQTSATGAYAESMAPHTLRGAPGRSSRALSVGTNVFGIGVNSAGANALGQRVGSGGDSSTDDGIRRQSSLDTASVAGRILALLTAHGDVYIRKAPRLSDDSPLQIGAAVCSVYALVFAFSAYAALFAALGAYTTMMLWAIAALTLCMALMILVLSQSYFLFTLAAQLAIDVPVFLGIIMGHMVLAVWMIPAVLFTATFSARKGEWFTALHMGLLSLAYALIYEDLTPSHDLDIGEKEMAAFLLFTLAVLLLLTGALLRFIHHQTHMQQADLEHAYFHLKLQNRNLQSELRELRNVQTEEVIGTPAEKVIQILRALLADSKALNEAQRADVNLVIRLVGSNKLYNSSVAYANIKAADGVDAETQKWVLDQLVQKTITDPDAESDVDDALLVSNVDEEICNEHLDVQISRANSRVTSRNSKRISTDVDSKRGSSKQIFVERMNDKLTQLLDMVDCWNFDIIEFHQETNGRSLYVLANYLFQRYDFLAEYEIPEEVFTKFITNIEQGYINNPYHNSLHAADVLQSLHSLITTGGLMQVLDPIEVFSCILSAIVHDFRHPGVNNNFLMSVEDPIALTFNDFSVLENYHLSEAFKLMADESCSILRNIPREMRKKVRKLVIEMVLCTDMTKHADMMGSLKNALSVGDLTGNTLDSRILMMKMGMKLADVSNPAKIPTVAREWTKRISDEFYAQGDKEKEKMLPVSPFMDRNFPVVSKSQIGFISYVVMPLAELWNSAMGTGLDCLQNLSMNLDFWKTQAEEEQAAQAPKALPISSPATLGVKNGSNELHEGARPSVLISPSRISPQSS